MLARLVAFDTTSHKSNLELIAFVEDYLLAHGIDGTRIPNEDNQKTSYFATIGPTNEPGVALSAHTDCVPVDGQDWHSDPFTLRKENRRLYGRGTTDMKGFAACALAAVPTFIRHDLKRPIHFALSYDEEIGCIGVRPMIEKLGNTLPAPMAVIVGEPTNMRVVDAHKGPVRWRIEISGRAAHSSMAPLGVNAITYASRLISEIEKFAETLRRTTVSPRFNPPYATMQVTRIMGGTATNIIPAGCWFEFDLRTVPEFNGSTVETHLTEFIRNTLLPEMLEVAPEADITMQCLNDVPPFQSQPNSPAVNLALRLTNQNETEAVSYATEAGLFQNSGAPSVVCGPGDIAQAHTANEWVAESQLNECTAFMERLADWASSDGETRRELVADK